MCVDLATIRKIGGNMAARKCQNNRPLQNSIKTRKCISWRKYQCMKSKSWGKEEEKEEVWKKKGKKSGRRKEERKEEWRKKRRVEEGILFFPSSTLLLSFFHSSFLSSLFLTFAFHALVFPSGNAFSSYNNSAEWPSLYWLLKEEFHSVIRLCHVAVSQ